MKILRIRGENLASLEQAFEVDLVHGALGRAGLFAITGPTGAGKSTLLDALCLCLYDTTPRLAQRGGNKVLLAGQDADGALPANDQRNILRRGAGSGWAEVDFKGRDGHTWTARWEVRRAHLRATGKPQQQTLSLRDAAGVVVAGKKTEVQAAIAEKVGLDFDQFRRSVMLAQGDFAAFLRADQNERAALLEQMTGTSIYTRLSQAAFFEKRRLEGARRELETRLDAQGVLSEDDRAKADQALVETTRTRTVAAAAHETAAAAARWHQQQDQLQQSLNQAQAAHASAQAAWLAAGPRRDALAWAERGWPLRELAQQTQQTQELAQQARAAQAAGGAALQASATALADAQRASAMARAHHSRALDALVAQVRERLHTATAAHQSIGDWLAAHPWHRELAAPRRQQDLARDLGRFTTRVADLAALRDRLPEQQQRLKAAQATCTAATERRAQADEKLTLATAQVQAAAAAAAAFDDGAQLRARRELTLKQDAAAQLQRLADQADSWTRQLHQATARQQAAQLELNQASAQAARHQTAVDDLRPRLDEARAALSRAQAALDAQGLRATLQPDEPCPVCGSADHPWADDSPVVALHGQQQARVTQLQQLLETHGKDLATARAQTLAQTQTRDSAAAAVKEATDGLDALTPSWPDLAATAGHPDLSGPAGAQQGLATLRAQLAESATSLAAEEASARRARLEVEAARRALELSRTAQRAALAEETAAVKAADDAVATLDKLQARLAPEEQALAELEASLAEVLDPAVEELPELSTWRTDPAAALESSRAAAQTVTHRQERLTLAAQAMAELQQRLPRDEAAAELAQTGLDTEDLTGATAAPAPGDLKVPQAVTAWLEQQVERCKGTLARREEQQDLATKAHGEAQQTATAAAAKATTLLDRAATAAADLQERGLQLDVDTDGLSRLLDLPTDWREQERAALSTLQDAPKQAATLLAERQQRLVQHGDQRPETDADQAAEALAAATQDRTVADENWSTAKAVLTADDSARTRAADLRIQLAAHDEAAHPWLQLASAIGSGSGDEFKRFAQSLTLEALLEQANHHLSELHPRYSLQRIHQTDLDILVVDHDLGDEPRTIQSLSGGESFLASLALALGLSSLSSRDVRVESLFIDEGFGTLDARTLDTALAVLDSLQAAGRQVGVISHVGGLAERIGVQVAVTPQGGGRSTVAVVER